jgi:hypothetical protein
VESTISKRSSRKIVTSYLHKYSEYEESLPVICSGHDSEVEENVDESSEDSSDGSDLEGDENHSGNKEHEKQARFDLEAALDDLTPIPNDESNASQMHEFNASQMHEFNASQMLQVSLTESRLMHYIVDAFAISLTCPKLLRLTSTTHWFVLLTNLYGFIVDWYL